MIFNTRTKIGPSAVRQLGRMIVFLLPVVLLGCSYLPSSAKPEVTAVRPRITGIDMKGLNLEFDLDVRNPYPVALKTPKIRYGFAVEGNRFAGDELGAGIELPARETGTATLPVRISYVDLWNASRSLGDAAEAAYTIDGAFLTSGAGRDWELPFSHTGKMPILKVPTIDVTKFDPPKITLGGAQLGVQADVKNPNVFGIGLDSLGWDLKIGELRLGGLNASTVGSLAAGQTGVLNLVGKISATRALRQLAGGASIGQISISPVGMLTTPYGKVDLAQQFGGAGASK